MCFMGGGSSQQVQLPPETQIITQPGAAVPQRNPNAGMSQYARLQVLDARGVMDALGNRGSTRQKVSVTKVGPTGPGSPINPGYVPNPADKDFDWSGQNPMWKAWYETNKVGTKGGKPYTLKDIMSPGEFTKVMTTQEQGQRDWSPFIDRFENPSNKPFVPGVPHPTTKTYNVAVANNAALGDTAYGSRTKGAILRRGSLPSRRPMVSGAVLGAG